MTNQSRLFGKSIVLTNNVDWEAVYQAELPRLYNFFRYRVGNNQVAEDLTEETFEKAWRNRQRFRHELSAFSTWLFTIAKRVAVDYFRKHLPETYLDDAAPSGDEAVENLVQQHSDFARLSILLAQLPDRDRELVALKYGAGLTNRMIAQLIGMNESTVGTILQRAAQHLRAAWEEKS